MSEPDFYKILGVLRSASADEIKAAYRELVKRYHPDIYSTPDDKVRATGRFQQINDAYAALGDPERRRLYDRKRAAETRRESTGLAREGRHAPRPRKPSPRPTVAKQQFRLKLNFPAWFKAAAAVLVLAMVAILAYANWYQREPAIAWVLFEQTMVESSGHVGASKATGESWNRLGRYLSQQQCADGLKEIVKRDEKEGSKAVLDERQGTIAITVFIKDEGALADEYFKAKLRQKYPDLAANPPSSEQRLLKEEARREAKAFVEKNGVIKRVRNLECRGAHYLEPESWLARLLRRAGLMS